MSEQASPTTPILFGHEPEALLADTLAYAPELLASLPERAREARALAQRYAQRSAAVNYLARSSEEGMIAAALLAIHFDLERIGMFLERMATP